MNFVMGLADHRILYGSEVEHQREECEGLRFDFSWNFFFVSHSRQDEKHPSPFIYDTELKITIFHILFTIKSLVLSFSAAPQYSD